MEQLITRLREFRDARDWGQYHTPKDLAISVSVEAGELLEIFQWSASDAACDKPVADRVAEEAADVFLYLLMLCDRLGIDLVEAGGRKIDLNERRFPVVSSRGIAKPSKGE